LASGVEPWNLVETYLRSPRIMDSVVDREYILHLGLEAR
jgi:hypothetical protein